MPRRTCFAALPEGVEKMATATAVASGPGDPGSSSSSSLGGQYEKLLATVGSLQGDLQRTVGVCQVRAVVLACSAFHCSLVGRRWRYSSMCIL